MTEDIEITSPRASSPKKKNGVWSWVRFILILGIAYILINNLIALQKVSGNSMNPTLQNGNVLLINKLSLFFGLPKYGDVVIIKGDRLDYSIVKRVIAVGGDRIAIADGVTYVNGLPLVELYTFGESEDMIEQIVGANELFVIGDNRNLGESLDSRDAKLGLVPISDIKGYAAFSLWPMRGIAKPLEL